MGRYILENGKDIYNHAWPKLYFSNFGDYYIIGPMYLAGLSIYLFGVNEFAVRLVYPFIVFTGLYLVSLWPFNYFLELVKEDHPVEYLQFFVLLISSLVMFYQSWKLRKQGNKIFLLALFIGLGFFFLAGDEISWGQRLIGLQTPEVLVETNRQQEVTIHNLYSVEWLVGVIL